MNATEAIQEPANPEPEPAAFTCGQCAFFEPSSFYPKCGSCGAIPKEQSFELMLERARMRFVYQPCTLPEAMRPSVDDALKPRTADLFDVFGDPGNTEPPAQPANEAPAPSPSVQAPAAFSMEDF